MSNDAIFLSIERTVKEVIKSEVRECFQLLREEVFKELGVSEYVTLSKAYLTYSEHFVRSWRRSGKLKNVGTEKRVKFRVSDIEKIANGDAKYQTYLQNKIRRSTKKCK